MDRSDYADHYVQSHDVSADTLDYRVGYASVLMLDGLLPAGYDLLDVGCGTAGYHRLLTRSGRVHGIDPNPEMIVAADRFKAEFGAAARDYSCCAFEVFTSDERFDAIDLSGVYGWYMPWPGRAAILEKAVGLLKPSGMLVASYVPPRSHLGLIKAALFPSRTVLITRARFLGMLLGAGLLVLLEMKTPHVDLVFARRRQ